MLLEKIYISTRNVLWLVLNFGQGNGRDIVVGGPIQVKVLERSLLLAFAVRLPWASRKN